MFTAKRRRYSYYQMKELAQDPDIDFSKKTMLFVSGYMDNTEQLPTAVMAAEYKALGYNALTVEMNWFTTRYYPVACRFMRPVGKHTAEMLVELTKLGLDPKRLELVGISLGGQTMSYIAKSYQNITNVKIATLIAMDPAGPCFREYGPEDRLDESDGDFVVTILTNIDGLGMASPVGHVNFYVNGGEYQPGDVIWELCAHLCSHVRSYMIWVAALNYRNHFIGVQCDSVQQAREKRCYERQPQVTNVLGLDTTDPNKRGIFYLSTTNHYPYYMGKKGLKREYDFVVSRMFLANENDLLIL